MQKILLLEDDAVLGQGIRMALQSPAVQVDLCRTLAQGKAQAARCGHDLLILDVNLPDGSGLELLEQVRRAGGVPVILLTASFKTLLASRKRNLIAIAAIVLTTLLFTSLFTIVLSINETNQNYQFAAWGPVPTAPSRMWTKTRSRSCPPIPKSGRPAGGRSSASAPAAPLPMKQALENPEDEDEETAQEAAGELMELVLSNFSVTENL